MWRSQKILLGEIDAAMAQDVVSRRNVEKELRHAESQQQRLAGELSLRSIPECEDHFFLARPVDLIARQSSHEIDRGRDTRLQFGNARRGIRKDRRFHASEQSARNNRMPDSLPCLARQAVHVGIEPRVEQNQGIDVSRLGINSRMIDESGQIAQKRREDADRQFFH